MKIFAICILCLYAAAFIAGVIISIYEVKHAIQLDPNVPFFNDEIEYYDELTNIIYYIRYVHEYKGSSRTSKGYFYKTLHTEC